MLGSEPVTTSDLAGTLGVRPRTVQQHLTRLKNVGLATRLANGWVKGPDTPEQVGELLPVAGAGFDRLGVIGLSGQAYSEQIRKFAMREPDAIYRRSRNRQNVRPDQLLDARPDPSSGQVMRGRFGVTRLAGSGTLRRGRPKRSVVKARKARSKATRQSAEDLGMEMVS